jgi:carbamoyltransferase
MKVLGVSYGYHDASACLVVDGAVVAASAEERFTRQKHDANFPSYAIRDCLERAGLTTADLDQVVFHEDPHAKFSRVLCAGLAPFPGSRREFVNSTKAWLGRKLWSLSTLSARLDLDPDKVRYLSHHFSHAVQAFMGSGRREAAILVVDAVGDWACSALFSGAWVDGVPRVERVMEVAYPNSLGLVYSAFTAYLGFSPNDSECSTMALAAFGQPRFADKVREIIRAADDTSYDVDQRYFHFARFYQGAVSERFVEAFGPPRDFKDPLPFACFGEGGAPSPDAQRFADVAASIQLVLEERLLALCALLHEKVPSEHLCYAGGVSLNCVANRRILTETPFKTVYIPPDPGDGGTCIGSALYASALGGGLAPESMPYPAYVGATFDPADDVAMLEHIKPDHLRRYLKRGLPQTAGVKWKHRTFADRAELSAEVARRLMDRQIVGWYQGRAELGPRALGNRSILVRPDDTALAARLSRHVKDRAAFRPYALSLQAEAAAEVLDLGGAAPEAYRWMQFAAPVRDAVRARVVAGTHVDGTTRPQVCRAEDNPAYHALLGAFGASFGLPVLLNTSFNAAGYPIVSTPAEALAMFARTDMDALVLHDTVIWKEA